MSTIVTSELQTILLYGICSKKNNINFILKINPGSTCSVLGRWQLLSVCGLMEICCLPGEHAVCWPLLWFGDGLQRLCVEWLTLNPRSYWELVKTSGREVHGRQSLWLCPRWGSWAPGLCLCRCFQAAMRWELCSTSCSLQWCAPPQQESADHGLQPLKPWARITFLF